MGIYDLQIKKTVKLCVKRRVPDILDLKPGLHQLENYILPLGNQPSCQSAQVRGVSLSVFLSESHLAGG